MKWYLGAQTLFFGSLDPSGRSHFGKSGILVWHREAGCFDIKSSTWALGVPSGFRASGSIGLCVGVWAKKLPRKLYRASA